MTNTQEISRRSFIALSATVALSGTALAQSIDVSLKTGELTPPEAYELSQNARILLIDIRRPDEWTTTGSAQGAHRLDMRRKDFVAALDTLVSGEKSMPVALICARGVRSDRMSRVLKNAGFTSIIDVPEGMLGSRSGPGWIKRGLPVNRG